MAVIRSHHDLPSNPSPAGVRRHQLDADHPALAGARNELLVERIAYQLASAGPLLVTTRTRRGGQRAELVLPDGTTLRLRYFWPRREPATALESIRWDDAVGWVVVVRTAHGPRVDYAWLLEAQRP